MISPWCTCSQSHSSRHEKIKARTCLEAETHKISFHMFWNWWVSVTSRVVFLNLSQSKAKIPFNFWKPVLFSLWGFWQTFKVECWPSGFISVHSAWQASWSKAECSLVKKRKCTKGLVVIYETIGGFLMLVYK